MKKFGSDKNPERFSSMSFSSVMDALDQGCWPVNIAKRRIPSDQMSLRLLKYSSVPFAANISGIFYQSLAITIGI